MAEGNWIKLYRKMIDDPIFVNSTGPQVKVLIGRSRRKAAARAAKKEGV